MRHLIFLVLFLLVFAGCRREEGPTITTTQTGTTPPPEIINATITTVVIGQDGTPIDDATITGLSSTGQPNPDGSLTISASSLSTDGTLVTVSSPGHWPERRLLMPAGNGQLLETFVLEPKVKAGEINSITGGAVVIAENFSVTLPASTIVTKEDGSAYTGPVDIYINHDAPEDRAEMRNSPGNALAQLENGDLASMESYGMMDIALETPAGEPLELDPSTPAEVRMPLLPTTTPDAPNEVGFWFLNAEGYWQDAGTATLGPNCYIVFINVSGGYNCDVPHPLARLCARLVDEAGFPLTHSPFSIDILSGLSCWNATIDCNGEFCAWVAADTDLQLVVTDECSGNNTILPVAPIATGMTFAAGDLLLGFNLAAFTAEVTSCPNANADLNEIEVWVNGYGEENGVFVATQPSGFANVSVDDCEGDDVLIQAFTRDYRASSPLIRRSPDDIGPQNLLVCGDLETEEYFTLSIDGVEIPISQLAPIYWPDNGNFSWLVRAAGTLAGEEYSLLLNFSDPAIGEYAEGNAKAAIYRLTPSQAYGEGRVYVDPASTLSLTGVSLNTEGDLFEGSFTATMSLQNDATQTVEAVNLPVTGTFRFKL
jgi:hypothetical protein